MGKLPISTFRAWDTTTGTASTNATPSYANPGVGGGTSAYSSETCNCQHDGDERQRRAGAGQHRPDGFAQRAQKQHRSERIAWSRRSLPVPVETESPMSIQVPSKALRLLRSTTPTALGNFRLTAVPLGLRLELSPTPLLSYLPIPPMTAFDSYPTRTTSGQQHLISGLGIRPTETSAARQE